MNVFIVSELKKLSFLFLKQDYFACSIPVIDKKLIQAAHAFELADLFLQKLT